MIGVAVLEILEMMERFFAVEDPDVLRLRRRQSAHRPAQMNEVRLDRGVHRVHADLAREIVCLLRVAGTARGHDVGPVVGAAAGKWDEVIARQ